MRLSRLSAAGLALACLPAAPAAAQEKKVKKEGPVVVTHDVVVSTGGAQPAHRTYVRSEGGDNTFVFVSSEMAVDGKVVKGAPYSAEAVTETRQTFADGNRIARKNSTMVYRDGEGRTRRDQTIGAIGPFASAGDPVQTVFIHDPVTGTSYILDPRTRTARRGQVKFSYLRGPKAEASGGAPAEKPSGAAADSLPRRQRAGAYVFSAPAPPPGGGPSPDVVFLPHAVAEPKVESLGRRQIEGVEAEGQRTTLTIPAGSIGNEQDINVVTERWYSPELQTVVMMSHSDPRFGETVYRLTNIDRSEPARSLFEVPSDYTLKEGGPGAQVFKMKQREPAGASPEN